MADRHPAPPPPPDGALITQSKPSPESRSGGETFSRGAPRIRHSQPALRAASPAVRRRSAAAPRLRGLAKRSACCAASSSCAASSGAAGLARRGKAAKDLHRRIRADRDRGAYCASHDWAISPPGATWLRIRRSSSRSDCVQRVASIERRPSVGHPGTVFRDQQRLVESGERLFGLTVPELEVRPNPVSLEAGAGRGSRAVEREGGCRPASRCVSAARPSSSQ
jgi:hypothetical protein